MSIRKFSNLRLLLVLVVTLKFEFSTVSLLFQQHFERDLEYCSSCFRPQRKTCTQLFENVEYNQNAKIQNLINSLPMFENRKTLLLKMKNSTAKVISKYFVKKDYVNESGPDIVTINKAFFDKNRLDGLQFCPTHAISRFINLWKTKFKNPHIGTDKLTIWLYMLHNIEPILLPYLNANGFPVPVTYATCGFMTLQEYVGKPLINYYNSNFNTKLQIAKQLLKAALMFSYGIDGFRMYITDMSADNIVYNEMDGSIYFVDLDSVYIIDSEAVQQNATVDLTVHKHNYIECDDCFAYDPQDICAHQLSDINVFAACQFLRENLRQEHTKGFLHPIPSEVAKNIPNLSNFLNDCVECPTPVCKHRFDIANKLIALIKT